MEHRDGEPVCTRRRSHQKDDRRRQEVWARGESAKPVWQSVKPPGLSKGKSIPADMIGAQVVVLMLWAGFGERHRSRRQPADHDYLDRLRAVARGSWGWCNSTTTRLNRPPSARAGRETPSASAATPAQDRGRASSQWLLRYCQGAKLSAVPRTAQRPAPLLANPSAWRAGARRRAAPDAEFRETMLDLRLIGAALGSTGRCRHKAAQLQPSSFLGRHRRNRAKYASP
jgi:hypothetical protein